MVKKQLDDELKKSRQSEAKIEMMRKKLDRKTDELSVAQKKLKGSSISSNSSKSQRNSIIGTEGELFSDIENSPRQQIVAEDGSGNLQNELLLARSRMATIEQELQSGHTSNGLEKQKSEVVLQIAELRSELKQKDTSFLKNSLEWLELSEKFIANEEFSKLVEEMVELF